jgi:uncharacterized membrane protein YphA (DoxX/SURF4 family)
MKKSEKYTVWVFQLIAAIIFVAVGIMKFKGGPDDVMIFETLGMEPTGRYLIGTIEIIAGLLLLTDAMAAKGAFLGIGVMFGAIIAHSTILGHTINNDGGMHIIMLSVVLISCIVVAYIRRDQLPFIGHVMR